MFRPLLISMFLTSTALATTWTVDDDGKADFDNIQEAIDKANHGDEIIVMPGTYTSGIDMLGKEIWLHSSKGAQVTIIDQEGGGRGIYCHSGETSNTFIQGFTITNCQYWDMNQGGAGILCSNSSPRLENCLFENNNAHYGGGMYNYNSNPSLTNCTFKNNNAWNSNQKYSALGGGMCNYQSSPTLTDCVFIGNTTYNSDGGYNERGGGMYNDQSSPTLDNCTFTENTCENRGGGMYNQDSSPTLEGCTFEKNTSGELGGGMCNQDSSPTLEGCTFKENTSGYLGGGMYDWNSSSTLDSCTFTGNTSENRGGGMYRQGGGFTLTGCTFKDNTANQGGGMYIQGGGTTTLIDCTFENNRAKYDDSRGGGILLQDTTNTLLNKCTFKNNEAKRGGGLGIEGAYNSPLVTLFECKFLENNAAISGGGLYISRKSVNITNCTFFNNNSYVDGGGLKNTNNYNTETSIDGCKFQFNTTETSGGSAIQNDECSNPICGDMTITNTIICGNTPNQISGDEPVYGDGNNITDNCAVGACCIGYTNCVVLNELECGNANGIYLGDEMTCVGDPCYATPVLGACCVNEECVFLAEFECLNLKGLFLGFNSTCSDLNCENITYVTTTIQSAINKSSSGDIVAVLPGTYNELINFNGKDIKLVSKEGAEATIIDGLDKTGTLVRFENEENPSCLLNGFTVTHGNASFDAGGIYCLNSSPTIMNCIVVGNTANTHGGGMYLSNSSPIIFSCSFTNNVADDGGGIYVNSGSPSMHDSIVCGNIPDQVFGQLPGNGNSIEDICTPLGACCIDEKCSVLSEDDCETANGSYLGDETTCGNAAAATATIVGTAALDDEDGTNFILTNADGSTVTFHTDPTKNFGDISDDGGDHTWIVNTRDIEGGDEVRKATQALYISCKTAIDAGELDMTISPTTVDPIADGTSVDFTLTQTTDGTAGNTAITLITGVTANGETAFTGGGEALCDSECPDINGDGYVNIQDLLIIIGSWGSANPAADFNFDGIVNVQDLLILIAAWGECE